MADRGKNKQTFFCHTPLSEGRLLKESGLPCFLATLHIEVPPVPSGRGKEPPKVWRLFSEILKKCQRVGIFQEFRCLSFFEQQKFSIASSKWLYTCHNKLIVRTLSQKKYTQGVCEYFSKKIDLETFALHKKKQLLAKKNLI